MPSAKPILLVHAPYHTLYGHHKAAISHYFPLGVGYLASFLEKHGFTVELLVENGRFDFFAVLEERLSSRDYLLLGISAMTSAFPAAVRMAALSRRLQPGLPVVLGGPHASGVGASLLAKHREFDLLCLGEGEITLLELVHHLTLGLPPLAAIPGLVRRDVRGEVVRHEPRPFHPAIDDFPHPARHLVDFAAFSIHAHVTAGGGAAATMLTSRGCPYACNFCSAHLTDGKKYRFHSTDYVLEELRLLKERHGVSYVFFEDDTITVARKRLSTLCQAIRDARLGMTFGCFSRVDVFDEEMAQLLQATGFRMVIFGIETGVAEVLSQIGKGGRVDVQQAKTAIDLCRRYGIKSYASFIVGFPFETREQVLQTLAFGLQLNPAVLTFNPLVPFPGTPLFVPERHEPATVDGWSRFLTTGDPPFDMVPGLPARELRRLVDRAHLRYYLHPWRIWRLLRGVSSAGEVWSLFRSMLGLLLSILRGAKRRPAPDRSP